MGAADHPEADEGFDDVTAYSSQAPQVDRSHNRDTLSSEAMTEMLRDVQDAMLALDIRLAALESAQGEASHDTSRLARGVVDMGDALTRRVRALEQVTRDPPSILVRREPAPPIKRPRTPPQRTLAWTAALVFVLAIVLGAFWLMAAESVDHATDTAATKPPVVVARPPAPAPVVADTTPIIPPPPPHPASHTVTAYHHGTYSRSSTTHAPPATNSTTAPTGFAHFGPSPSTSAPASAPPHPPS